MDCVKITCFSGIVAQLSELQFIKADAKIRTFCGKHYTSGQKMLFSLDFMERMASKQPIRRGI